MKKLLIFIFIFSLVLVGCATTKKENKEEKEEVKEEVKKEVITEYTVKANVVMPEVNEIDFTSIKDRGNAIYSQRFIDNQLYFELFNTPCYPCGTKGDYVDFYSYNLSTQGFEVSELTLNNQNGIPFNNGILVLNRTFYYSAPLDYSLMFYSKEGDKEIFSANKTYDIYRVFASEQFIYVGQTHSTEFMGPITFDKVLKYDKEGKLVEEIEIPIITLEYSSYNLNIWYIENDEVKIFERPQECWLSNKNLEYQQDSNKLILLDCNYAAQESPYSAFDTTTKTVISLLPETMTDVVINQIFRIDDDHLFIANVAKGNDMAIYEYEYYSYNPNIMSFGIYRISDNQYIPIKDENLALGRYFNFVSNQVLTHQGLDFGFAYNQPVGIMKLSLDGSTLNATLFPIDNINNYINSAYFEDNHLFLSLVTWNDSVFTTKLIYFELEK